MISHPSRVVDVSAPVRRSTPFFSAVAGLTVLSLTSFAGAAPAITVDATSVDFGSRDILNGREARQIVITNTGDSALEWTGDRLAISGADAATFSSSPTSASLSSIAPASSVSLVLYLDPSTTGPHTATATLYTNDPASPATTISLAGIGTAPAPHDWSQYMGTGEHTGRQPISARVTRFDQPIWTTEDHGLSGSASPTVVEDPSSTIPVKVLAWGVNPAGTAAFVKAFNGDSGELLWQTDPILDLGNSVAYSSWHSMAADKESGLAFLGMGAHIYAYHLADGAFAWKSAALRADGGGVGNIVNATVTVGKDFVYQTTYTGFGGTNFLQAFRKSDGTEAWYHGTEGQGQETVVYHQDGLRDYVYRMTSGGSYPLGATGINCHDGATGAVIWSNAAPLDGSTAWGLSDANFGGISFHDGRILVPTYNFGGTSQLACVNAYTGALVWIANNSVATDTSPVVIGDTVYVCGHFNYGAGSDIVAFDLHTGARQWVKTVSNSSNMWTVALAATDDSLYFTEGSSWFASEIGGLHRLDPVTGLELSSPSLSSMSTRGSVAIGSDGSIYVLSGDDPFEDRSGILCYRAPRVAELAVEGHTTTPATAVVISGDTVEISSDVAWATEMRIRDSELAAGAWVPYNASQSVVVSDGDGLKTFLAEYRNGSGETAVQLTLPIHRNTAVEDWQAY